MSPAGKNGMIQSLIAVCLGVSVVIAGCGGSSGTSNGNGGNGPVDTTPPQISDCGVEPAWSQTGPFAITAHVTDDTAVQQVYAIVTPLDGLSGSTGVYMPHQGGSLYSGEFVPNDLTREQTFRVSIHAADATGNTSSCSSQLGCILSPIPDLPF